jgi:hypothetical protein
MSLLRLLVLVGPLYVSRRGGSYAVPVSSEARPLPDAAQAWYEGETTVRKKGGKGVELQGEGEG